MTLEVVVIERSDTYALRRSVLRNGDPDAVVAFDEDLLPGTMHLGLRDGAEVVATSSWMPRPLPAEYAVDPRDRLPVDVPAAHRQLRGMATANGRRGTGIGGLLLEAGCRRCADAGDEIVWARARDAALQFYERHGFEVLGDGFVDATTGLPHHVVRRRLT
jgi:predicted GNAT family N-acyltransferase